MAEPSLKCKPMNFMLCFICQDTKKKEPNLVSNISGQTYDQFISCLCWWRDCQSPKYAKIAQRLQGFSGYDLNSKKARWHHSCYSQFCNVEHIAHAEKAYKKSLEAGLSDQVMCRQQDCQAFLHSHTQMLCLQSLFHHHHQQKSHMLQDYQFLPLEENYVFSVGLTQQHELVAILPLNLCTNVRVKMLVNQFSILSTRLVMKHCKLGQQIF